MAKQKRLGDVPWDTRKEQIRQGAGIKRDTKTDKQKDVKTSELPDKYKKANYYIRKKDGVIMKKLTVPLPVELVIKLKGDAELAGKKLAEYIQGKLE